MTARRVTMKVEMDPWVVPFLELLQRLGCGAKCEPIVSRFVFTHGVRVRA